MAEDDTTHKHTFCRICEPFCPMLAEINGKGKVIKLKPNLDHPSGGIACHKGLSFLEVHTDPDRLNWPQRRLNPRFEARGNFVDIDWESAMRDIGVRLKSIREKYGHDSIAFYFGNPPSFNASGLLMATQFQDLIDTKMRFSPNSQDTANKFAGAAEIYGSSSSLMVPDLYNTDYLLCLGTNPKVSRWTVFSVPNDGLDQAKRIKQRGGKVRFVNPRKTESSTSETGPTLLIKPATDVYFLAALLNEIEKRGGFDQALLNKYGKHVGELKSFIVQYPAEKVAQVTGITAAAIKEVATEILAAKSAAVYMATGINQSRQGMLCNWLVEMINFATGNLGRTGGSYKPNGIMRYFPPSGSTLNLKTSMGVLKLPNPVGFAALPATILPDLIENGDIRALVIMGGNPLLSVGGGNRMRKACEKLDLMVISDIYRNATGEISDYVLPTADWLERKDINLISDGLQPIPYVQYTDAMEPPAHGRRHAWWIMARMVQAMGLPSPLDANPEQEDGDDIVNSFLAAKELSIDKLKAAAQQTVTFPQGSRDSLFEYCLQHPDKKIDCYPASFTESGLFERCHAIFSELEAEPDDVLKLISLRTPYIHNSWLANTQKFRRGKQSLNPLNMCEDDAAARGLHNGDAICISTPYGAVETQVLINNDLRTGAVAMSHGYGHQKSFALKIASKKPGANYNALMPIGAGTFEPLSYMSWLSGIPITVKKVNEWNTLKS